MPRATELNALIFNGIDQMPESDVPKELRKKLWAEHLGSDVQLDVKPGQGWLSTWKAKAKEKLDGLTKKPYKRVKSKVLEWNSKTNPEEFLQEHKINTQDFDVRTEVRQFDFETGRWIDE